MDIEAFAQYLDISQLEAEKFELEVDENSYVLYYGYHGSLDDSALDDFKEPIVAVALNQERKSIEFAFEEVPEKTDFWVRIPFEVLTAEKEKYQVFVNELDTGYDLMKMPDGYVVGLIISEDTKHVEIIGTNVIPEFGAISILIFGIAVFGIVFLVRKSPAGPSWTRIN
ncbi:MAG: PEFG-CTERM domain-containing protein [Nitrosopumilus sp.]|nr:PEFG-CTERM domain-containing protein [Nitrosopumilus sp.]